MRLSHLLVSGALALASVSAQEFYIPSNTPATGTCNVIPFGTTNTSATWVNQVYQTVVTDADLGSPTAPLTLCNLAFANCGTQVRHFDSLVITFGQLPGGTLGATFAANLVNNVAVVLAEKNYRWSCTANVWSDIGLTSPYTYIPGQGDLVIEIVAIGNHLQSGSGSGFHRDIRPRVFANTFVGTPPLSGTVATGALIMRLSSGLAGISSHGIACGGLDLSVSGGSAQLGQSLGLDVTGAPAGTNGPFFVCFGVTLQNLDLSFVGGTGCTFYPNAFACVAVPPAPPSPSIKIAVPNDPRLICGIIYAQALGLGAPINPPFGILASNYLRIGVGN
jgi:hypothetical protein